MKKVLWAEMRRPEFEQAVTDDAIVIIPVGATEQHGAHLPVNTDSNACFSVAKRAAEAIDEFPVLVLPTIWTGYSLEHMARHGAISLKYHTLVDVLTQVAESVYAHGFKKILFLNGHGGNTPAVSAMRIKLSFEHHFPPSVALDWCQLPSVSVSPGDGHSGMLETAAQLYLQPDLVDKESLFWTEGIFGDPSKATRQIGEELINGVVNDLVKTLRDYYEGKIDDGWGWSESIMVGQK